MSLSEASPELEIEAAPVASKRSSLKSRFAFTGGQVIAQTLCFQGTTFVANIVLARWFGPAGFGMFSTGLQTLNSASQTAQLATASVGSRYLGVWYDHDRDRAIRGWDTCRAIGLKSGILFTIACVVTAPLIATHLFAQPNATLGLAVAGAGVYFVVASQQLLQAFTAVERVRTVTLSSLATGLIYLLLTLAGGYYFGPVGSLAGIGLSYLFLYAILSRPAKRELGVAEHMAPLGDAEEKNLKGQLLPASISGVLLLPSTWLLLAIVSSQRGASQAGVFSAATQIRLLLMTIPQIVNSVGIVLVNRFAQTSDSARVKRLSAYTLLAASALTSGIGYLSASLLPKVFGARFADGVPVLRVLAGSVLLESCILLVRQRLQLDARYTDWLVFVTIPWQLGTFLCAAMLVPHMGALGAAISYAAGLAAGLVSFAFLRYAKSSVVGRKR